MEYTELANIEKGTQIIKKGTKRVWTFEKKEQVFGTMCLVFHDSKSFYDKLFISNSQHAINIAINDYTIA